MSRRFFPFGRRSRPPEDNPRIYAIGDIHGRMDLLEKLIAQIHHDVDSHSPRSNRIIILGDFIDRGPASADLVELFMRLRKEDNIIILKGNHEAAMYDALDGDFAALDMWLAYGGAATLKSFGVDIDSIDLADTHLVLRLARDAISKDIRSWICRLPTFVRFGDYYFVHAGVKPGISLTDQTDEHRLWITDEFTRSSEHHGAIIVHGHTIQEDGVYIGQNRIGIDTGAYRTNCLSAVALEDAEVRVLSARSVS
jgi:serine/threonine protein phosphatase 1